VRSTLSRFIGAIDPEAKTITPSSVRASFATAQFVRFRRRVAFHGQSEEMFLDDLSKIMNTSSEQLKSVYIACSAMDTDHDRIMAEVHKMFQLEGQERCED
jgi:hypothetical protein